MIGLSEREQIVKRIEDARAQGARLSKACQLLGISPRTLQRWRESDQLQPDGRTRREFSPDNKLSEQERQQILAVANSNEFAHLPPSQIVPILAERGIFLASESTFYRVLRDTKQPACASSGLTPRERFKPPEGIAGQRAKSAVQLGHYLPAQWS